MKDGGGGGNVVCGGEQREQRAGDRGEARGIDEGFIGILEIAQGIAQRALGREADAAVGDLAAVVERLTAGQENGEPPWHGGPGGRWSASHGVTTLMSRVCP